MARLDLREHRFLGATQSMCPDCLAVVPAKIVSREGRVYFRKQCRQHGTREDFVCSDDRWFDRMEFSLPGKIPAQFGVEPRLGCPYDCGLCSEHEQHTCIAVLEITSSCNLTCPMCYASSAPGGVPVPLEDCQKAIQRLIACEGRPEVLQLSGGEPTVHPQFAELLSFACQQPIDVVMVNTNGLRINTDSKLRDELARWNRRCEVYFQFDGFDDAIYQSLRGGKGLLDEKLRAIEWLGQLDVRTTLVCTLQADLNVDQLHALVEFGIQRPWITGVSFQPATYVGRHVLPEALERRVTFPDVILGLAEQSGGKWKITDFLPLPCAHPNAHSLSFAYRESGQYLPLPRFIDIASHLDLLANGITFTRASARELIHEFLGRQNCGCDGGCSSAELVDASNALHPIALDSVSNGAELKRTDHPTTDRAMAENFFRRCLDEDLSPVDVFRITTTSFMDAYNFDIRQLMKSCVHHLLPTGHLIPFCAYNLLYRDGHVALPPLQETRIVGRRPVRDFSPAVLP